MKDTLSGGNGTNSGPRLNQDQKTARADGTETIKAIWTRTMACIPKSPTFLVFICLVAVLLIFNVMLMFTVGSPFKQARRMLNFGYVFHQDPPFHLDTGYKSGHKKPNIVFIVADDLGWNDVGWHNPHILTPNLDKLAKAGVILNFSYVQPLCSPSRNSFMTGYFPYHTGLQQGVIRPEDPSGVPTKFKFVSNSLKDLGYSTHAVGKWHLGFCDWKYTPLRRGFDTFFGYYLGAEDYYTHEREGGFDFRFNESVYRDGTGKYSTHLFADRAVEIINDHDKSRPLFLYVPFQAVHGPVEVPLKYEQMHHFIHNDVRRKYSGMVTAMDEAVGQIVGALEKTGLADNLFLVWTTDNGGAHKSGNNLPLRGDKGSVWEGGTRGPAFVYSKNLLNRKGYVHNGIIHAVDWYPTFVELAGGRIDDKNMDGVSQIDMLLKGSASNRTEFVYNIHSSNGAIRHGDLKLIQGNIGKGLWYPLPGHNGSNDFDDLVDDTNESGYMLFNITADPFERHDIAQTHPHLVETLKQRYSYYKKSAVSPVSSVHSAASNPKHFGGVWSPGWC